MTSSILIFANLWRMRAKHRKAERPFLFPGGRMGLVAATGVTWVLAILALVSSVMDGDRIARAKILVGAGSLLSSVVVYLVCATFRARRWRRIDPRKGDRGEE